jgi:hypothetical protein
VWDPSPQVSVAIGWPISVRLVFGCDLLAHGGRSRTICFRIFPFSPDFPTWPASDDPRGRASFTLNIAVSGGG